MKKKLVSILLTLAMILSLFSLSALAAERDEAKDQVRVIVENTTWSVQEGAAWDGTLVDTWVDLSGDSTAASCVVSALTEYGYTQSGAENNYIFEIQGLTAGTYTGMDGWMVTLNDWFINEGMGAFTVADGKLEDGDEIRVQYSSNGYGEDLGGVWGNNDKTVKSVTFNVGTLNQEFNSNVYEYGLTVPAGTTGVVVTPTATNKNFQVRTTDVAGIEYKRTATIPVFDGSIIYVTCGDPSWPTMNNGDYGSGAESVPAVQYIFHISVEEDTDEAVESVISKINAIGTVTLDSEAAITAARSAYDSLTDLQKESVTNYTTLTAAEAELTALKNAPTLTGNASASAMVEVNAPYTLDLGTIFTDVDNTELTYTVSINGADAIAADKAYTYIPTSTDPVTLVFTANDGKSDSPAYTVTLTVETAKAKLASLIVHTSTSPSNTNVLLKNASDTYTNDTVVVFDPDTLTYTLESMADTNNQLRFRAAAANSGDTVTLHYGDSQTKDITWTSGSSKWANCLSAGRNELKLVVNPAAGSGRETVTYTIIVEQKPTLTSLSASTDAGNAYWDKKFSSTTYDYTLTIPVNTTTVTLSTAPKYSHVSVTYNGAASNTVDVTNTDTIAIVLHAGEVSNTYTITLNKTTTQAASFSVTPSDAVVRVYDAEGNSIAANPDGSYSGMFSAMEYTYTVTKYGYVAAVGTIPAAGGQLNIEMTKAPDSQLTDVSAYWPNFRGNDVNQAITDVALPIDPATTELIWNKSMGTGWSDAPSIQIIVDDALVVMVNKNIYKLDLNTGEILAQGAMVDKSSYGFTSPVYAEGMIICALTGGTVQAFNADTLESLWVYKDALGGQDQCPVIYSDGYVYTGFWNGETKNANFVCLSITDEDPSKADESKTASWTHTQPGGFYWAGAVVIGDAVIVGTDDGGSGATGTSYVYSFNKITGEVISKVEMPGVGDQRSTMAYDAASNRIYFTTKGGYLCRVNINATTGELSGLKTFNNQAQSTSTPVVYKGKVYYGTGSGISSTGSSGNLVVADAESLEMLYAVGLKGYPQCSMLLTTAYEETTGYIYLYSTYNSNPGGISMIKVKPDQTTADGAELIELYDAEGFSQYCITSIICGPDGTLYYKNDSRNVLAVAVTPESKVIDQINAIGTVTLDSEEAITAARAAYDALSEEDKALVTNADILTAAESALAELKQAAAQEAADQNAADEVIAAINAIGTVTLESENVITAAETAYNALTDAQKAKVTNADVLTAAKTALAELKQAAAQEAADQKAADEVIAAINAIGTVTLESENAITAAETAYNALTDTQKAKVTNADVLTSAKNTLAQLKQPEKVDYQILSGADSSWKKGSSGKVAIICNGEFDDFTGLKVDNLLVDPSKYTVAKGSTIVTLESGYLETLSVGTHTVIVMYVDGEVSTGLTVLAASQTGSGSGAESDDTQGGNTSGGSSSPAAPSTPSTPESPSIPSTPGSDAPDTGDHQNSVALFGTMFGALVLAAILIALKKKYRFN